MHWQFLFRLSLDSIYFLLKMVNNDNICVLNIPGVNGLGVTVGTRDSGKKVLKGLDVDFETVDVDNFNVENQERVIYERALKCFENNKIGLFLGGDHSISYSTCKAFLEGCKLKDSEGVLIVFDAHVDLMIPMKNPTHEEWLRALIEKGFDVENIVIIGARKVYDQEKEFLEKNKIKMISVEEIREDRLGVFDWLKDFCNGKEIYVSLDIDVIDPEFVKGTHYLEPSGLSVDEVEYFVEMFGGFESLRGFDLVEINLDKDDGNTVEIGRGILRRILR
jgi:agmatinase